MANQFEENKVVPQWVGWGFVVFLSAAVVGWALLNYALVQDAPRQWDFGQLPQTPGESIYSSNQAAAPASAPAQLIPMPELQPKTPAGGGSHD